MRALIFAQDLRIESDHPRAVRGVVRFACGACGNHSAQVQNKNDSHSRRGRASKLAADLHAGRELATLMAVVGAIQGIAPVTAPMIGALIAEAAGWREIFMLLLAIGVSLTALRR